MSNTNDNSNQTKAAKAGSSRALAHGTNSFVTVLLVLGLVGVANFLVSRYPQKLDLTKNKLHTLSDQTSKVVKGLAQPVKAAFFATGQEREKYRPLLENYKALNPKFELEFVDPTREPTRAKTAGIKRDATMVLMVGARENKVEDPTEEKLTNALIKLLKDKSPALCAITGHGEKSISAQTPDGYEWLKKALTNQSYEIRELQLPQETKIPDNCDAILIAGPSKSFFEPETKALREYLANGGRAVIALDLDIKNPNSVPELNAILADWYVRPMNMLVVDPFSRMLGVDAAVPIVGSYSKESPITKDFQAPSYFPFLRPLEIIANAPASLKVQWIAQTTPKSFAIADLGQLTRGQVKFDAAKDKQGPLNAVLTVDGKLANSKATRNTRLVVFGTSAMASNDTSRHGSNSDFFLNAVSWVMEDESLISIRAKEDEAGKIELTADQGRLIGLLSIVVLPALLVVGGVIIWAIRRKK